MLSWRQHLLLSGYIGLLLLTGCPPKDTPPIPVVQEQPRDYGKELPPGMMALEKIDPSRYPDFSEGYNHRTNLEQAAQYSLEYLSRPSSQRYFPYLDITHERSVASVQAFLEVLRTARSTEEFDAMIKQRFEVYQSRGYQDPARPSPGWTSPDTGIVWFTGYYRPIFDARLQPEGEFRFPLYKKPPDLVQDPATFKYSRSGGGAYYTRSEIENGVLAGKGLEMCYLRDPFEAYIVTVQGSGKLRMADGSFFEIGYAGDNGHEYGSIGKELVKRGDINPEQLSLQGLIRFFRENPDKYQEMIRVNDRYVFFTPRKGGPYGSLNVPVSPFRTIATDKEVYPRAGVAFLTTLLPARAADGTIRNHSYSGFAMDQDTGGAIRAAGRCDVFMGTGPEVGELAGRTQAEGQLYYIYIRPDGAGTGGAASLASPSPTPYSAPEPAATQREPYSHDLPPIGGLPPG
ncbi:MAG: hypothetical protein AMXMBFR13_10930 [Phycisphaerae bacterium]